MWILPKSIISAYVPGTEVLTLDSGECSQTCAQSLTVRSKRSQLKTFLREWKRGNWMRLRSGAISKPFLGSNFMDWWTSSLAATRASHSVQPETEREQTTPVTSGRTSQAEFDFFDQSSAFSRMLKDTFRWDCPALSATWKSWVIKCRGEYSQRLNAARLTSENECSYLPTPCANEDSFRLNGSSQQSKTLEAKARRGELKTIGSAKHVNCLSLVVARATMLNLNVLSAENGHIHLFGMQKMDAPYVEQRGQAGAMQKAGPLNPQFVEVMMGLPIGWTDCASSETE
jgi:hypothetical protein